MMPFKSRQKIFEAIRGSTIHQSLATPSSEVALTRCENSIVTDPGQTLELVRIILQQEINTKIQAILSTYIESHLQPAVNNMKHNLGEENVPLRLVEDACISILENAKEVYMSRSPESPKKVNRSKSPGQVLKRSISSVSNTNSPMAKKSCVIKSGLGRPNTDLILVNKSGRPVRREGPRWEADRLEKDTLFILGSRANKALGFGQTRGRLYIKHPELFKYSGDQTDKEWLAKANLMATTGGKAYLMVLSDILQLAQSPEYSSHPKQQPEELVGFSVPVWMIEKMRAYIETAKTNPDTTDEELLRMAEEYAEMETDAEAVKTKKPIVVRSSDADLALDWGTEPGPMRGQDCDSLTNQEPGTSDNVAELLSEVARTGDSGDCDDFHNIDPAFLSGMNLNSLVREFEMEASGILDLADDSGF